MSMPKAPGQNILKIVGFFYIVTGVVSLISALIVRFSSGTSWVGWMNMLTTWRLTAVNSAFAMLERLHFYGLTPLSDMRAMFPEVKWYKWYAVRIGLPIGTSKGMDWNLVAVIISIFVIGVFIVFIGIIAAKHCDTLKHTKFLMICALINLVMMAGSTVIIFSFLSLVGCVIAFIFFVGAFKNYRQVYPKQIK